LTEATPHTIGADLDAQTTGRPGFSGARAVNVLELDLALDGQYQMKKQA
jgi:K+-transporting ATPase c subunit